MGKKYIIEMEDLMFHKTGESGAETYLWRVKGFNSLVFDRTGISKLTPYTEPDLELIKKKARDNGYSEGYQDGYSKGMNDYLQSPEVKEESDRAYAHGYSDAESKFNEIRKEAYEKGFKDAAHNCEETCTLVAKARNEGYNEGQRAGERHGKEVAWAAARKIQDAGGNLSWWIHNTTASEVIEKLKAYEQEKEEIKVGDEVKNTQTGVKFIVTHLWENNRGEQGVSGFNQECSAFSTTLSLVVKTGRHFPEISTVLEKMRNEPNAQIDT